MMNTTNNYAYQYYLLRSVSDHLRLPDLKKMAAEPGVQLVYRISCHTPGDPAPPDSVATVLSAVTQPPQLSVYFHNDSARNFEDIIDKDRFQRFVAAMSTLKFDRLNDQPNIPAHGVPLWLVERAAGGFTKSVLLSPQTASGPHQTLIFRIHEFFPEAVGGTNL